MHIAVDGHAIFCLHQHQIAAAESKVPEAAQRRLGAVGPEKIGPERLQSTAAAQGVKHVERHVGVRICRCDKAVQREPLSFAYSRNPLPDFRFPPMKVVESGFIVARRLERELICALVTVGYVVAVELDGCRV